MKQSKELKGERVCNGPFLAAKESLVTSSPKREQALARKFRK